MLRALTRPADAARPRDRVRLAARVAALLALVAVVAHAVAFVSADHGLSGPLLLVMAAGCAVCAIRCLQRPCAREVGVLLAMATAMVLAHLALMAAPVGAAHAHGALADASGAASAAAAAAAAVLPATTVMAVLVAVELLVMMACAVSLRLARSSGTSTEVSFSQ